MIFVGFILLEFFLVMKACLLFKLAGEFSTSITGRARGVWRDRVQNSINMLRIDTS